MPEALELATTRAEINVPVSKIAILEPELRALFLPRQALHQLLHVHAELAEYCDHNLVLVFARSTSDAGRDHQRDDAEITKG